LRPSSRRGLALDTCRTLLDALWFRSRRDRRVLKGRRGLSLLTSERQVAGERRISRGALRITAAASGERNDSEREGA
jgi:hypothetical protein